MKDHISNETLQAIKRVTLGRWGNGNLDKIADHLIDTRAQLAEVTRERDSLKAQLAEAQQHRDEWFELYTQTLKKLGDAREQIAKLITDS